MQIKKENNDLRLTSVVGEEVLRKEDTKGETEVFETPVEEEREGEKVEVQVGTREDKSEKMKRRQSVDAVMTASPTVKALVPNSISLPQLSDAVLVTEKQTNSTTCTQSSSSAGKASLTRIAKSEDKKEEELDLSNPHNLLISYLREEGYQAKTRKSATLSDFFLELKSEHIAAYNTDIVKAVRDRNLTLLRQMYAEGKQLQCSNRFGESLLHMACRRGYTDVVRFLIKEADVTLRVKDDFGRTPLHDACWSASPNFDLMDLIIEHDPDLLLIEDVRGHSPFSYARQSHWKDWRDFLTLRRGSLRLNTFTD